MSLENIGTVNVISDEADKVDEQVFRDIDTNEKIDVDMKDIKIPTKDEVARLARTSNILMLTDEPEIFINEENRPTPLLIVARCKLDDIEYGALYDLLS